MVGERGRRFGSGTHCWSFSFVLHWTFTLPNFGAGEKLFVSDTSFTTFNWNLCCSCIRTLSISVTLEPLFSTWYSTEHCIGFPAHKLASLNLKWKRGNDVKPTQKTKLAVCCWWSKDIDSSVVFSEYAGVRQPLFFFQMSKYEKSLVLYSGKYGVFASCMLERGLFLFWYRFL